MKRFSIIAASFIFTAFFATAAFAQAQPAAGSIGLVNTYAFSDDKEGIVKFRNALKAVDAEFAGVNNELKTMGTRYTNLGTEIQAAQKQPANSAVPVAGGSAGLQAKIDEFQTLETNIKRKQEDAKAQYEKRYAAIVGPIYADIVKAMNDFAKAKGYSVILDGAKLEEAGILMGFNEKYDVTKEFVVFYNARPAGTASTVKP